MSQQPRDKKITYSSAGVKYDSIDPIKVLAQKSAISTSRNLKNFSLKEVEGIRGESAYVWDEGDSYRALVVEGLGTKNLVADEVAKFSGKSHYDTIAQDTVAMIVNDLIVVGALPVVINAYFAIGDSNWMDDRSRAQDLIKGWQKACELSRATWGGGETPALKGVIEKNAIDLAGSAVGVINDKSKLVTGEKLREADAIVLIESSGVHANGISLIRALANKNPDLYEQKLASGQTFGEAVLKPTHIYVDLVRSLQESEVDIHYMANITGHGWRKIMRANYIFSYIINYITDTSEEFALIQQEAGVDLKEMYGNYNMGAGFAIFVTQDEADKVIEIAEGLGLKALNAGKVEKGEKKVAIKPLNIEFKSEELGVR